MSINLGMMISLRQTEPGSSERRIYNRLRRAVDEEIAIQLRQFGVRARCTATYLLRTEDTSDFLHCWIYDVFNTSLQYNELEILHPKLAV